jgi:thioredoxin reductase (NADPH)
MAGRDQDEEAFPRFDEARMNALASRSSVRLERYQAGQTLFRAGDPHAAFFVVKSGEVEIVDQSTEPPRSVTTYGPGQFTGEVAQQTGAAPLFDAVARTDCEVYVILPDVLRETINKDPVLGDIILKAFLARRRQHRDPGESGDSAGPRLIGSRSSQDTFRLRDFLTRNRLPFSYLDLESDPRAAQILGQAGLTEADTPVVICGRNTLRNPSERQIADVLGLRQPLEPKVFELAVIGAGPAGLAAAVCGASEGLSTVVLERSGPGGQAGRSMRIENYLGFPTGVTGDELIEGAVVQVCKFGATLSVPSPVAGLSFDGAHAVLRLDCGETVRAKCVLIATGTDYLSLDVPGCESLAGRGVYYAASFNEVSLCHGADVVVVGGGNSAGQAAVFLAGQARKVFVLNRGDALDKSMSSYLARRIEQMPNIEVLAHTEVRHLSGEGRLDAVGVVDNRTGAKRTLATPALFSFLGVKPRTDWLPPEIERDAKGFVRTGSDLKGSPRWSAWRPPFPLEASRPGVFAAGDVRSGSAKRIASAAGEGATAIQFIHEALRLDKT